MPASYAVPTVRVRLLQVPEQEMIINESDFDPDVHQRVDPSGAKPAPKRSPPKDGWESITGEGVVNTQPPPFPDKSAVTEGSATDKPAAKRVPLKGAR